MSLDARPARAARASLDARVRLAVLPTPLEPAERLGAELGIDLWIKRDDLTGLGGGGNKARRMEYLCAHALELGADTIVCGGRGQSNQARVAAAAANCMGMDCTIVLGCDRPEQLTGNMLVDHVLGARIVWAGVLDFFGIEDAIDRECARLEASGRTPYPVPMGGTGGLGYVRAAFELRSQDPGFDLVVVAAGSGCTQAGLVAGLGDHSRVLGVDVGGRPDLDSAVPEEAARLAKLAGLQAPDGSCRVDHRWFGAHQGAPTDACREAITLAARLEGLLLDPIYTGKAMSGLIGACRSDEIAPGSRVVFWHTGGIPGLHAETYERWLAG